MSKPLVGPRCLTCRHIRADYTCEAFPHGIPEPIVRGIPHTEPYPGDHGLRYEERPAGEPEPVFVDLMLEELTGGPA